MNRLKTTFAVANKYEAFYTTGKIQISNNGLYMFCGCGNKVHVIEVKTGKQYCSIGQEEDEEITSFCLTPHNEFLIVATKHLVLRQWDWQESKLIRTWKAIHVGPISTMGFDITSTLLATGSADSTIKLWDIEKQYCTHNLKGHQGVVRVVQFHPDISLLQLFSAADDYKVRVWDLQTSSCIAAVDVHYSVVTSLVFSPDGSRLYSCSRDQIVAVWDVGKLKVTKKLPVFESIESLVLLPEKKEFSQLNVSGDSPHFITAGVKGVLKVWNADTGRCVYSQNEAGSGSADNNEESKQLDQNIIQLVYSEALNSLVVVSYDHNINLLSLDSLKPHKQFTGDNEEILDIHFLGKNDSHIVVATNSEKLKVFELSTWNCQILDGHSDIVLSVGVHREAGLVVTSSKDNSVRVWKMDEESGSVTCVGVGYGHTHHVGTVTMSSVAASFVLSGSHDNTLKMWPLPSEFNSGEVVTLHARITEKAHDKGINSVAVAPNERFVASGSQDKTAKLWNAKDLTLLGVMRGHKRGIWCVQFSPLDQCLVTTSGDGTLKLWALTDYSCVRTFEGHDSSVLRVTFVSRGMQLLSCGSDGLLKLWTIKNNECVKTMDEHEDKIWALAINSQESLVVTGGADATVIVWKDMTEIEVEQARASQEDLILKEQELSNLILQKKYLKAIGLAITLEQPFRVLSIIKEVLAEKDGSKQLEETLAKLRLDQIDTVLRFSSQWNTNSKNCHQAQFVLSTVLRTYSPDEMTKFPNIKSTLESLIPYTERHFQRMNRLLQQAQFVEYTWQCMRTVGGDRLGHSSGQSVPVVGAITETSSGMESDNEYSVSAEQTDDPAPLTRGRPGDRGHNMAAVPIHDGEGGERESGTLLTPPTSPERKNLKQSPAAISSQKRKKKQSPVRGDHSDESNSNEDTEEAKLTAKPKRPSDKVPPLESLTKKGPSIKQTKPSVKKLRTHLKSLRQ